MMELEPALAAFAALDEEALARPWTWRDREMNVREALYRTLEDAQEAQVLAVAGAHAESRRILALAHRAFGDLRGLLAGLPAALLDAVPQPGEWPVREILRHVAVIERRYALQTRYAVERSEGEPVRIPEPRLAGVQVEADGDVGTLLARIRQARAETDRVLGAVAAADMSRPTIWVQCEVDVRFRLHRFAAHVVEHTIQCEKHLDLLGWRAAEGRRIARRLSALIAEVEALGPPGAAQELEARALACLASITGSGPSAARR